MTEDTETLTYEIFLEAAGALQNLAELTQKTTVFEEQLKLAYLATQKFAQEMEIGFLEAKNILQQVDESLIGAAGGFSVFGNAGAEAWKKVGLASMNAGEQTVLAAQEEEQAFVQVGEASENSSKLVVGGVDLVRRAMSFLVGMILFQVLAAFQSLFTSAIKGLKDMENATYNLINAEERMSQAGIAITPKDLDETIKKLQQLDPLISKVQATQAVSGIATKLGEPLGLNKNQIDSLSQSIAVLSVRNAAAGKSFEDVAKTVEDGLLSGRVSRGINDLGIKINQQTVEENALKMGLVESAKAYKDLSAEEQNHINAISMINLLEMNTNSERSKIPAYLNTVAGAQQRLSAVWQDFLTMLIKTYGPEIITGLNLLSNVIEGWSFAISKVLPILEKMMGIWIGMLRAAQAYFTVVFNPNLSNLEKVRAVLDGFKNGLSDSSNYFKSFADAADTATAQVANSVTTNLDKAMEAFDKFRQKLQDVITEYKNKEDDLNVQFNPATGTGRKVDDLNTEYQNKEEDALLNYQQKVEDINRDINRKEADLKTKARLDEYKAEKDHLEKLRQLRQQYLFDLEDALHNRDARQVLRLMAQYNMEKENEDKKYALDTELRKKQIQQEQKDLEAERKRRIEDAQLEYKRKLEDLEIAKAREYAAIVKWRQREEDDLKQQISRRIAALVQEYIASENYTAQYLGTLLGMINQFAQQAGIALGSVIPTSGYSTGGGLAGGTTGGSTGGGGNYTTSLGTFSGGLAEGGSFLATTPRSINVAEQGPELITGIPLNSLGANVHKLFTDFSGKGGGNGGKISIDLNLSPDLEARIVQNSVNTVADVVTKVNRSR